MGTHLRPHSPPRPLSHGRATYTRVTLSCCLSGPRCLGPNPALTSSPRDSTRTPAHSLSLSPVSFRDCDEQQRAVFLSDDTRFEVSKDGVVSATRPLQLQQQQISFSVQAWDTTGKRHSASVTLRRRWHHHHLHHRQRQQVEHSTSPRGHRSWGRACAGLGKVLAPI